MQDIGQIVASWTQQPGFIMAFIGCGVAVGLLLTTGKRSLVPIEKSRSRKPAKRR